MHVVQRVEATLRLGLVHPTLRYCHRKRRASCHKAMRRRACIAWLLGIATGQQQWSPSKHGGAPGAPPPRYGAPPDAAAPPQRYPPDAPPQRSPPDAPRRPPQSYGPPPGYGAPRPGYAPPQQAPPPQQQQQQQQQQQRPPQPRGQAAVVLPCRTLPSPPAHRGGRPQGRTSHPGQRAPAPAAWGCDVCLACRPRLPKSTSLWKEIALGAS